MAPDMTSWQPALDGCPETAGIQLERPKLDAGEPWCVAQIAGLQFYDYSSPGLNGMPLRPDAGERLNLIRRPDNPADSNAIEVWLRNEHKLGHVPRELASAIAPELDRGAGLRAYALGPGTGAAWSVRTLFAGPAVAVEHRGWVRWQARLAENALRLARRAMEDPHRARGLAFAQRQERARADRLTQAAARTFEALPLDPAPMPPAGQEHEAWWLASPAANALPRNG